MTQKRNEPHFTERQETALLKAAAAAVREGFPNTEHPGCPELKIIRDLAHRRIPLDETGPLVDHIATCSPCFLAYNRYRNRYRSTRRIGPIVTVVVCLLALALTWWTRTPRIPVRHSSPLPMSPDTVLRATLDYRTASPVRSSEPIGHQDTPQHLSKRLIDLVVLLPFGTEDGDYSIEIRGASGQVVVQAPASARWNGTAEELKTRIDCRPLAAGQYTFALQRPGSTWRTYELVLEEGK